MATSRTLGDIELKEPKMVVSHTPDVKVMTLREEDLFAVLMCDGIHDVLEDQEVTDIVLRNYADASEAAKSVVGIRSCQTVSFRVWCTGPTAAGPRPQS